MPQTRVDLEAVRGEDWVFSLSMPEVDFSNHTIYFTIVEDYGLVPYIDVASTDAGQTMITVAGSDVEIRVPYAQANPPFDRCKYSILAEYTPEDTRGFLIMGDIRVVPVALTRKG